MMDFILYRDSLPISHFQMRSSQLFLRESLEILNFISRKIRSVLIHILITTFASLLSVIAKKGQGTSSFVHMLVGSMKKIKGNVFLSGKIAYLPEKHVFSSASVK